ncbi:MAG: SRPBCC family protein [Flavobacteriaceae bacterium]|nr:SRPBCC family protein [Flavobacteriaceae bacterium]
MKFECSIIVEKPRQEVANYFADPKYLKEYQDTFISKELISGIEGKDGAVSKMLYKQGKGKMELTETIVKNNLPYSFEGHYHHKHMDNTMHCEFVELETNKTKYISSIEYTELRGFMPKAMAYLFPRLFKKQVQKWLDNFKEFVENQK